MYRNILAAIDGSAGSAEVLDIVGDLAKLTGAEVRVLHIEPSLPLGYVVASLEDDATAKQLVDKAVTALRDAGITADGEVLEALSGDVPNVIVQRADKFGSDLIVVGPNQHSHLDAFLHGSVSREVARRASTSVLLVTGTAKS